MKNFIRFINEKAFMSLTPTLRVNIDVLTTKHSTERQSRHLKSNGEYITDGEIKTTMRKAFQKITNKLIFDEVNITDDILIKYQGLNLVCNIQKVTKNKKKTLVFKLITVMKKENFKAKKGTFVIDITK